MKNKKIINIAIIIILIAGAGLVLFRFNNTMTNTITNKQDASREKKASFKNITADQLSEMLNNKDFFLVNVHPPYIGEIPGTDDFISFDEIENNLDRLPGDKNAKIVVYCQSGGMSGLASQELADLGYKNVYNLSGGMIGWKKAGYSLDYLKK